MAAMYLSCFQLVVPSGKSLCYTALPSVFDILRGKDGHNYCHCSFSFGGTYEGPGSL